MNWSINPLHSPAPALHSDNVCVCVCVGVGGCVNSECVVKYQMAQSQSNGGKRGKRAVTLHCNVNYIHAQLTVSHYIVSTV